MRVRFLEDFNRYRRDQVVDLDVRTAAIYLDRAIAVPAPEADRADAAAPRESVLHHRETSPPPPRRSEGPELHHSAPVPLRFK